MPFPLFSSSRLKLNDGFAKGHAHSKRLYPHPIPRKYRLITCSPGDIPCDEIERNSDAPPETLATLSDLLRPRLRAVHRIRSLDREVQVARQRGVFSGVASCAFGTVPVGRQFHQNVLEQSSGSSCFVQLIRCRCQQRLQWMKIPY